MTNAQMDNPVRGRFNAWLLDALDGYMDGKFGALKTRLFSSPPPVIVELGPGSGANFRYYPPGTEVIAFEPNVRMHEGLRRKAEQHSLKLDLRTNGAESLDLPDKSVGLVCSSLVLCSVKNPAAVIAEVHRVLQPGGRFVCLEHVPAPQDRAVARLQRLVRRPWRWLFEGCNLHNDTELALRAAGFRELRIEPLEVSTIFVPIRFQIAATCIA